MVAVTYKNLALDWQPQQQTDARFRILLVGALCLLSVLGVGLSLIDVPEKPRHERAAVPDRVARFVTQAKPVTPPKPRPEPEPIKPPPPPVETPPRVERERPKEQKPLTQEQKEAREVAEKSGLLALRDEMAGLMDTGARARSAVAGNLNGDGGANVAAGHDANVITAGTAGGSGGVDGSKYAINTQSAGLKGHELNQALDSLAYDEAAGDTASDKDAESQRAPGGRSRESVALAFDQYKGLLYSLYERERRKTLGLQGLVVVELTINPDGTVANAKIVSSELNSPSLEQRLIARIKTMTFAKLDVPELTVTFPIEFLPS